MKLRDLHLDRVGGRLARDFVFTEGSSIGARQASEAGIRHPSVATGITIADNLFLAAETIVCYQRQRFRGSSAAGPGRSRYELGLQTKKAAVHSLVEICAAGEAIGAIAFETAGLLDQLREAGRQPEPPPPMPDLVPKTDQAVDGLAIGTARLNRLVSVFGPACELCGARTGARKMREAVNLLGGSGVIEDGPGLIGYQWAMSHLDAAAGGVPEPIQLFRLAKAMTAEVFVIEVRRWILDLQTIAKSHPPTGAHWLATAMEMWLLTLHHFRPRPDAGAAGSNRRSIEHGGVEFELADILCCLLASRSQILDVVELRRARLGNRAIEEEQSELVGFLTDLCHVQVGFAAAEVARVCAHSVHGDMDATAREPDWLDQFNVLHAQLDGCHAQSFGAKERAAELLTKVEIPEGMDCG